MNLQVFVWDSSQEKINMKKNMKKPKNEVSEKVSFSLILFCTKKINNDTNFWYHLADKI